MKDFEKYLKNNKHKLDLKHVNPKIWEGIENELKPVKNLSNKKIGESREKSFLSKYPFSRQVTNWVAASVILSIFSYYFGKYQSDRLYTDKTIVIEKEITRMKQLATISLLESKSASKRIQAVNYVFELENPDNEILKKLIDKMHFDEHVNVRIAIIRELSKFSSNDFIRKALVKALDIEKNEIAQIELIQVLVSIKEKTAIPTMRNLLNESKTPNHVCNQLKLGIKKLNANII